MQAQAYMSGLAMDETMLGGVCRKGSAAVVSSSESRCKAAEPLALSRNPALALCAPRPRCPIPIFTPRCPRRLFTHTHNTLSSLSNDNDRDDEREEQRRPCWEEERRPAPMQVRSGASESLPLHSLDGEPMPTHLISHGRR